MIRRSSAPLHSHFRLAEASALAPAPGDPEEDPRTDQQPRRPSLPGSGVLAALGTTRVGTSSRLPIEGGGSGFSIPVQCKIGKEC